MISEYEAEPVPGLPGNLPSGERILWQGKPDTRRLMRTAYHVPLVAAYFAALAAWGAVEGNWTGVAITLGIGGIGIAVLALLAWGSARTTVYTLTDRRLVLRIGIALPTCINLPLSLVGSADLHRYSDGTGDLAIALTGSQRLGWVVLWPHARPWKLTNVQPMLRSIPEAEQVAGLIARTTGAAQGSPVAVVAPRLAVAA